MIGEKKKREQEVKRGGFLLFEVLMALLFFGIVALAYARAIHKMVDVALNTQREAKLIQVFQSALTKVGKLPQLEEGIYPLELEDKSVEVETEVTLIEDLENEEGSILPEMYVIKVRIYWWENDQEHMRETQTYRYARLYR